ncbi:MAG: epoxyqueuosine reductase QueH [Clostridiales bacterium]|nr:epoxyqueuosine reductase QueH [Clostridiales bacterium]
MELLLHACCGPCSMYPQKVLQSDNISYDMLWFNPNIHPEYEWNRRLVNLRLAADHYGVKLHEEGVCMEDYWKSKTYLEEFSSRCLMCYDMRMDMTAKYAKENGYSAFSTTLLVSPYQQHEAIIESCRKKAEKYGIEFYYYDFREGFREGQNMARDIGLYRQKYCGCIFSLDESDFKEKILKSMT